MHDFSLQKMVAEHIEREHQSNLSKLCTLQKLRNLNSFKNKFLKILKKSDKQLKIFEDDPIFSKLGWFQSLLLRVIAEQVG